jgi:hypothetical protein
MSVGVMKDETLKMREPHDPHTLLRGGLEHLKKETRLIDEMFPSVMGERENVTIKVRRLCSK